MFLVTLRSPIVTTRRDRMARAAAEAAIDVYEAAFERLDLMARQLRAGGWREGAEIVAHQAAIADFAARAERRHIEEDPT